MLKWAHCSLSILDRAWTSSLPVRLGSALSLSEFVSRLPRAYGPKRSCNLSRIRDYYLHAL